jgi:hypothetical protein
MIDKYNLDLKNDETSVKESVNIYNELRPHYSNYMLTPNKIIQSQVNIKQKTLAKCFASVLVNYCV